MGVPSDEIEKIDLNKMTNDEIFKEFKKRVGNGMGDTPINGNSQQRVISVDELSNYLESGWEFVSTLPDNKIIIKSYIIE